MASIEKTKTVEGQKAIWENQRGFKFKKQEQKSNKSQLGFDGQKTEPRCHDDATDCARILSHPFIDSHVYQTKHQDNQSKDSCFISRIYYFTCICVFATCLSCHGRSHTRWSPKRPLGGLTSWPKTQLNYHLYSWLCEARPPPFIEMKGDMVEFLSITSIISSTYIFK